MVDAWPGTLPGALQSDAFGEGVADGLLEYAPDTGPPITRRRSTAAVRLMKGTMLCTSAQIATFRTFFDTTLLGGSLPFNFPDQLQSGTLLVKFAKSSLPNWSAHPGGGDNYLLNLTLQVLP
jgi:hypothetical protein